MTRVADGPWQGAEKTIRPPACRETLPGPVKGIAPLGGGNATRVSPACATLAPGPVQPAPREASVRRGRVGYWLGGPGSRQACGTRSAGPGRWPRPDRVRRGPKWVLPSGRQPMRPARSQQPAKAAPARRPAGVSRAAAVAKRWTGTAPGVTGRGRKARPAFPPPGAEPPVLPVPGISQHRQPGFLARTLRQVAVCPGPQGSGKAGPGQPDVTFRWPPRLAAARQRAYQTPVHTGA